MQLKVSVARQELMIIQNLRIIKKYLVSTAAKGVGECMGSEQTPRGWHIIRAKIGHKMPINTVFVRRRPTGEIYSRELAKLYGRRDWILTRILWLSGLDLHKNRLGNVDTMQRYIYIHGSPDEIPMGIVGSRGCIRMRNEDVIELFDWVAAGTKIFIGE